MLAFAIFLLATHMLIQSVILIAGGDAFIAVIVGTAVGVVLPVGLVSLRVGAGPKRDFHLGYPGAGRLVAAVVVAICALVPTSYLAGLSERISPIDDEWLRQLVADLPNTPLETVFAFLAVTVAAPLSEEVVFRGIIFRLARGLWGPLAAAILSSLVFGLVHFEPWYFFGLVGVGLFFAFVYETTRSLVACWLAHGVHNACSLALILADRQGLGAKPEILDLGDWRALAVSLLGLVAAGTYLLGRRRSWF
jgi:hypothetical protein